MRRLPLLAAFALGLAGSAASAAADEHLPSPNLEFNISIPLTSLDYAPGSWLPNYEVPAKNESGSAQQLNNGKNLIAIVADTTVEHPSFRLPGLVRAAYIYGYPYAFSKAVFTYAGEEFDGTIVPAPPEKGLIAKIENIPWFKRGADGKFASLELRLEGPDGGPAKPNPKPVIIEKVVITTGIQAQTDSFEKLEQTVWPALTKKDNWWTVGQSENLRFLNSSTAAPTGNANAPSTGSWTDSVTFGIGLKSISEVASLNPFAAGPFGTRLEVAVPANTSWVGVNATRGPLFGDMRIQQTADISGDSEVIVPTKENEYYLNKLVWFRSLDPLQKYNLTLSAVEDGSAIGVNNITFYSGIVPGGEYKDVPIGEEAQGEPKVDSTPSEESTPVEGDKGKSGTNIGAIVGGVVGGVVGLALLLLLLWCCCRRRKARDHEEKSSSGSYFKVLGGSPMSAYHSNGSSGPMPPEPATLRSTGSVASKGSFGYTAHNYGGSYEPLAQHIQPASKYANYTMFPPTRSVRKKDGKSESPKRRDGGNEGGAGAAGGGGVGGGRIDGMLAPAPMLERRPSSKKRAGVPWGLQAPRAVESTSSCVTRESQRTSHRRSGNSDGSAESHGTAVTAPSVDSSYASHQRPWLQPEQSGDKLRTLSTMSTASVPLSAVGVPSGPWHGSHRTDPPTTTGGLLDAPRPRANRAVSAQNAGKQQSRAYGSHRHTG